MCSTDLGEWVGTDGSGLGAWVLMDSLSPHRPLPPGQMLSPLAWDGGSLSPMLPVLGVLGYTSCIHSQILDLLSGTTQF